MPDAASGTEPIVRIEGLCKTFGVVRAIDDLTLSVAAGEFFALLGPSGCGKTSLLRILAGFETPDCGRIFIAGQDMANVPPHRRPVNMMFQSYALFPHMTVAQNIGFGLKQQKLPKVEIAARVAEMLRLVQLTGLEARRPDQLSGGQRQRVALARALARRPALLLLDEPLAALDKNLREETQRELVALQAELKTTFIVVTHDQREAIVLSQRLAVMRNGRFEQVGTPAEIYERPASRYVAEFVGEINLIEATISGTKNGRYGLSTAAGVVAAMDDGRHRVGAAVILALRPERLQLRAAPSASDTLPAVAPPNCFVGKIAARSYRGDSMLFEVMLGCGLKLRVVQQNGGAGQADLAVGTTVHVTFGEAAGMLLPA